MKRSKRLTALILSALLATQMFAGLTVSAKDSQVFEKFDNGNFEESTDLYDDWLVGYSKNGFSIIAEPEDPTNHVMYVDASGDIKLAVMAFTVRKNARYRLEYKVKPLTDATDGVYVEGKVFNRLNPKNLEGMDSFNIGTENKGKWTNRSINLLTTSDEVYLQLYSNTGGKLYFDDFKLVPLNGENLGFEEEGSTNKNIVGNYNSYLNIATENPHSGIYSAIIPGPANCNANIRLAVKPYTQYDLTFWANVGNEIESGNDQLVYTVTKPLTENPNDKYAFTEPLDLAAGAAADIKPYSLISNDEPRTWVQPSGEWKKQTVTFTTGEETEAWLVLRRAGGMLNKIFIDDIHLKALRTVGNGDFEIGQSTVDGWTVNDATVVTEGTNSVLKLDSANDSTIAEASQVVATAQAEKVELRYRYKNVIGGHNVEILNVDDNNNIKRIMEVVENHTEAGDWVTNTIVMPAADMVNVYNTKIRFYNCDVSSEVYIDDVEIVNEAPRIIEARLYGSTVEGNTLIVNIERIDETGDALDFARVIWQYQGDDGKWKEITAGNDIYELPVDASIAGKTVIARVIPYGKKGYVTDTYVTNTVNADTQAESETYIMEGKARLIGSWTSTLHDVPAGSVIYDKVIPIANVMHVLNIASTTDNSISEFYRYVTWFYTGVESATAQRVGTNIVIDCKFNGPVLQYPLGDLMVNDKKVSEMTGATVVAKDSHQFTGTHNKLKDVTMSRGATITIPESELEGQETLNIKIKDQGLGTHTASVTIDVPEKPKAKYEYVEIGELTATYTTGAENIAVTAVGSVVNVGSDTAINTPIYVAVYDGNGKLAGVNVCEAGELVKGVNEGFLYAEFTLPLNTNMTGATLSVFVWDDTSEKGMDPFASKTTENVVVAQ